MKKRLTVSVEPQMDMMNHTAGLNRKKAAAKRADLWLSFISLRIR